MEIYAVCHDYDEGGPVAPIALFSSLEAAGEGLREMKDNSLLLNRSFDRCIVVGPYTLDPAHITLYGSVCERSDGSTYTTSARPRIPNEISSEETRYINRL